MLRYSDNKIFWGSLTFYEIFFTFCFFGCRERVNPNKIVKWFIGIIRSLRFNKICDVV